MMKWKRNGTLNHTATSAVDGFVVFRAEHGWTIVRRDLDTVAGLTIMGAERQRLTGVRTLAEAKATAQRVADRGGNLREAEAAVISEANAALRKSLGW